MSERSKFTQRLSQLIAEPSVSCTLKSFDQGNLGVINLLANWLETLGFDCEIQHITPEKANLIACLGKGTGGLVLSGHADTVPFDESRWDSDPFTLTEKSGRLYGLGTCDMKGFFPVVLAAIEALTLTTDQLKHPLIVLATADEESSMNGAKALVKSSFKSSRYAIVGEPTSLKPIRMHKGITMERINIVGKAGHSSDPEAGANAIDAMHEALSWLKQYRQELATTYQNPGFRVSTPTMNFGCIHGGDNPNRICGQCQLDFDIRPLPGMNIDDIHNHIAKHLNEISSRCGVDVQLERLFNGVDAFEEAETQEIVKLAENLSGHRSESVAFATEAPFLQELGMQTIVMGPGSIDQAHQPNEFLDTAQIEPAIEIIRSAITRCCL